MRRPFAPPLPGYASRMNTSRDVLLTGGPFDGDRYDAADSALIELESDNLIHRYIATTRTQDADGKKLPVYQFDGTVAPDGGLPGTENPADRLASPLADELRTGTRGDAAA